MRLFNPGSVARAIQTILTIIDVHVVLHHSYEYCSSTSGLISLFVADYVSVPFAGLFDTSNKTGASCRRLLYLCSITA